MAQKYKKWGSGKEEKWSSGENARMIECEND